MSWVKDAIAALRRGEHVTVRPRGGSMRGRIEDGQPVTIAPVEPTAVQVGDVGAVTGVGAATRGWGGGVGEGAT